jgi:hypothetical protein
MLARGAASARRSLDFVKARLGLLQQLCGLEQQAALQAFLHVHTCFNLSEETISKVVAGLQPMLAGSRWTAEQLVASHPELLGEPCHARLTASRLSCVTGCMACNAVPFNRPTSAPAAHCPPLGLATALQAAT